MTSGPDSENLQPAIAGCLEACRRCEVLVDSVTAKGDTEAFAAIGPHLRHCVDHFNCLLRGIEPRLVDYDARDRSERLEADPRAFREALASIVRQLAAIDPVDCDRTLSVRQAAASEGRAVVVDSNLARELVFLSGHTIHHLAIMRLLARAHGVELPVELDVAFSTEAHQKQVESMRLPRTG